MGGFVDWSGVCIFRRLIVDIGQLVINMSNKPIICEYIQHECCVPTVHLYSTHTYQCRYIVNTLSTLIYMRLIVLPSNTNRWLQKKKK